MKQEARLWALEVLTVDLLVIMAGLLANRDALLKSVFDEMDHRAQRRGHGTSAIIAEELQASVHRLRHMAEQQISRDRRMK